MYFSKASALLDCVSACYRNTGTVKMILVPVNSSILPCLISHIPDSIVDSLGRYLTIVSLISNTLLQNEPSTFPKSTSIGSGIAQARQEADLSGGVYSYASLNISRRLGRYEM